MYQTRQESSKLLPIPRKGTKYVAKASSNPDISIPVVIAVRDILHLAKTADEVKMMIKQKSLKINGKVVREYKESIHLLNLFEADKMYRLTFIETKKFSLEESKDKDSRICKVVSRRQYKGNKIQLNLHDGTNVLTTDKKIKVNDSVILDLSNKIKNHIVFDKGKIALVFKGKYLGKKVKIKEIEENFAQIEGLTKIDKSRLILI